MWHQTITFSSSHCLKLLIILQVFILSNTSDNNKITFPCHAPNGSPGVCLYYNECANLTDWRIQNNIHDADDVKKMLCGNDEIHLCCNRTNYYFPDTNYITQLNPKGLEILNAVECNRLSGDRVSNGKAATLGQYPFMALLKYNRDGGQFLCGGTLITSLFVLTAAHCITQDLSSVRLGEHDTSTDVDCVGSIRLCLPKTEEYEIAQIFRHPYYSLRRLTHDVALLKLKTEVITQVHIKPICLPISQLVYDHSNTIRHYDIAGWGRTESNEKSNVLQHAKIRHRAREDCQKVFSPRGVNITLDHICAGGENEIDTCKGDSGGPLFATVPFKLFNNLIIRRQVQFGIVSFGITGCGGKNVSSAAYSNLMKYMPWLTEIIGNNT
ncbi:serine protease grass [Zeugodacus cucurbitae]|uniref:serine protease grass n=1 Tax=Zeugodacus cucurbitae TaxID=28588 RepID=UPI0023D9100A|nr:serine protease grass [Zeugodacus cucurbitae]XP_054089822.1 serine protease grass [Zeugodacus cucurbitae]XP_054089823.1 serine protease grass [Zeugodacus cucurbitae]